jgi:hypothetical protein
MFFNNYASSISEFRFVVLVHTKKKKGYLLIILILFSGGGNFTFIQQKEHQRYDMLAIKSHPRPGLQNLCMEDPNAPPNKKCIF